MKNLNSQRKAARLRKICIVLLMIACLMIACLIPVLSVPAFASADVAGAVTDAFNSYMKPQIEKVVDNVVFPLIDAGLAIALIVKLILAWMNYRRSGGDFEWHIPAIIFCSLVVSLTAPLWIWNIIGWGKKA